MLDEKDYVVNGGADGRIALGALFEIGLVITNIGTAVVLFPIARRHPARRSRSAGSHRIVESTINALGAISLLSIVTPHRESGADPSALLVLAEALVAIHDWTFLFGVVEPGDATDVLVAPEIAWEAGLGRDALIKGFKTPAAPLPRRPAVRDDAGTRAAAATAG